MEPGDLVILYTDGITEATDAKGHEFGAGRLKRIVAEMKRQPVREVAERIMLTTGLFSGEPSPKDDQTVVVIRRRLPEPKVRHQAAEVRPAGTPPGTTPPSGGAHPGATPRR